MIGTLPLREAIAARHAARTAMPCAADNVVVVPGAQGGLYCALQCLAGAGDEVVVFEPTYATYEAVIGASGATMVTVPLVPERGFPPRPRRPRRGDHRANAGRVDQQPAQPHRRGVHRATRSRRSPNYAGGTICGCCRTRSTRTSPSPGRMSARARCPAWPSARWSSPACRNRTQRRGFAWAGSIGPPALQGHLFNLLLCMTYGGPRLYPGGRVGGAAAASSPRWRRCGPTTGAARR